MEENDNWVFFKEIDWDDVKFNRFNVDTRDFHVGYQYSKTEHKDIQTLIKYDRFFFTKEELINIVDKLYNESGGAGAWKYLELLSDDSRILNWKLKYLRIFRTDLRFIICNSDNVALTKELLELKINNKILHHH